jgi:uncharacterized membrane protein YkgB
MNTVEIGARVQSIGTAMLRYGVVVMLLMIGSSKWTLTEAEAIQPWVANSPFLVVDLPDRQRPGRIGDHRHHREDR